jgi:lipid II:glycine glycyltransferase (peptidoglycan interpeptide bridge formation enzyme)
MRQIKSGLKNGASILEGNTETHVKAFYALLKQLYSTIRKPLPPIDFFIRFLHDFCEKEKGIYLLISFQGKIIGGIMCLFENKETIYEWYIGSNHNEYRKLYPGVLSTYAAIEYGKKNGFRYFDFMGAGQQNKEYTVRDFKLTFGGNLQETTRWQKINFRFLYKIALIINKLFK